MRLMRMVLSFRRLSGISSNFTVTLSYKSLPQRFIPAKKAESSGGRCRKPAACDALKGRKHRY